MATQQDIDRLSAGVKAAAARGDMETAKKLGIKLREIQASIEQPAQDQPVQPASPAEGMSAFERFGAGIGSGALQTGNALINTANDLAEWIDSTAIGGAINDAGQRLGLPSTAEARVPADQYRREVLERDRPLTDTTAGKVGNVVGSAVALSPTAAIPGAGTYLGAGLIGAGTGAALSESGERAGGAGVGAVGGLAGKAVGDKLASVLRDAVGYISRIGSNAVDPEQAASAVVQQAIAKNGLRIQDIPDAARRELVAEVRRAMQTGGAVDDVALARKADFASIGAVPTLGQITRDPQQYAFEQTLQGVKGVGRPLAEAAQDNNSVLIDALNKAGANRSGVDLAVRIDTGKKVLKAAKKYAGTRKAEIDGLYQRARDLNGGDIQLDGVGFVNRATAALNDPNDFKIMSLPADVKALLKAVADGDLPLSVGSAEGIKSHLAGAAMTATRAGDGNAVRAIGKVRDALEMTSPSGQLGADTIAAFNAARAANRKFMGQVEKNPFLKAVIDGESPDDAFIKHFATADIGDVRRAMATISGDKGAISAVKADALNFLKRGAIGDSADEAANFSQSGFNRALARIGLPRLRAMGFTEQEIGTLLTISRVSTYMQKPPAGSKVNSSNTSAQAYNLLTGLLNTFRFLPFGKEAVVEPGTEVVGKAIGSRLYAPNVPATQTPSGFDVVGRAAPAGSANLLLELMGGRHQRSQ